LILIKKYLSQGDDVTITSLDESFYAFCLFWKRWPQKIKNWATSGYPL